MQPYAINEFAAKAVLVTGASTGIGAAVAAAFARHGAQVAIHYHRNREAAEAGRDAIVQHGGRAVLIRGDLGEPAQGAKVVGEAAEMLGGLDILINNAGSLTGRTPFLQWTDETFDTVMNLNARSVITASQAAVPHLEAGGGTIVNIGSIAGSDGGGPGAGHYAAAKAYVHSLTRHMARDLAGRGIRVNAVAPGVIATPFHAATPPDRMEAMRNAVALGRVGEPDDCVGPILFLCSGAMSGYVTGQILHVNGGQYMP
ncbi:SDR family NAD(P)-dependent oxidoreductase [Sphingomonas bacterium]|uniref:SDR family NAD(P)-dependent oxidoreductase n=1 Tax=Sphingomonas bacterium TaxID=1895847 RepID=UPI0015758C5A|nr:SDR family oxidoreductase [Sphingomonas bacterium]